MVYDKETNKPKGYAFIEYAHTRDMKGLSVMMQSKGIDYIYHSYSLILHVLLSDSCIQAS